MKSLLVMRHAKSSWKKEGVSDHDRPLNERGKSDAPRMGRWLAQHGLRPERILCSSAKRAKKTAKLVADVLDCAGCIEVHKRLYAAGPEDYIALLQLLPDDVQTAMIIAHDPTISHFVSTYAGAYTQMPTGSIAQFDVPVAQWSAFGPGTSCTLVTHGLPKSLPEEE